MIPEQTLLGFPLFGDNATKVEPDNNKKSNGWQQGDVVPAEWMNWEWYHASKGVADLNKGVSSMEKEINAVLASFGITAAEATNNQLLTAMRKNASFVTASSTTITGPLLIPGGTIRVMFTDDILGTDTTTGLTISYNGQSIPVKYSKDGTLYNFCAHKITTGVFKYLQAYTSFELLYDTVQLIIVGNPIVLSSTDFTIYANGKIDEYVQVKYPGNYGSSITCKKFGKVVQITVSSINNSSTNQDMTILSSNVMDEKFRPNEDYLIRGSANIASWGSNEGVGVMFLQDGRINTYSYVPFNYGFVTFTFIKP